MKAKTVIVLGDGGMATRCVEQLVKHESISIPLFIYHEGQATWTSALQQRAKELGIRGLQVENVNDPAVLAAISDLEPDIIFSVNNFDIIKADLLEIPTDGILNFHNGPLPAYRGVNIPSWAIINQEQSHGVCWHYVDAGIDTGSIVARETFNIDDDETAISLTFKCIETGLKLFEELVEEYVHGALSGVSAQGESTYYSRKMTPNDGFLDFSWNFDQLSAHVRALSFRPFENDFVHPKIRVGDEVLVISEIEKGNSDEGGLTGEVGEVLEINDSGISVRAADAVVHVSGLMDQALNEISVDNAVGLFNLGPGTILNDHGR